MGEGLRSLPFVSYLKVATFGDSTANTKMFAATNYGVQTVADRQTDATVQQVALYQNKWQLGRYYPAAQIEYNGGISGETTTQMQARSNAAEGPTRRSIEDTVAASPDLIILRGGSINDISSLTASTPQSTIDAVFTRHMAIVSGLAAGGAYVLDEGIAGFDAVSGVAPAAPDLAFIRAALVSLNTRYAEAIAALGNNKVRFLSPIGITCDETGAFLTNCSAYSDGTHLSNYGQERLAQAERSALIGWIGPSVDTAFPGTNLIATQAAYPSPSTISYGTVPSGTYFAWSVTAGGTRQNAAIESIDGVNFASCEMVVASGTPELQFTANLVPLLVTPALVAAGDVVSVEADFYLEAVSGFIGASGLQGALQLGISSTDRIIYSKATGLAPGAATQTAISGREQYGKIKIPASVASLTTANTFLRFTCSAPVGSTVRMKVGNVRIVKQ